MQEQGNKGVILVVDDANLNREFLRLHLLRHEYELLTAENGKQAMEVLSQHPEVDLILLDLIMPVMDGFDFLEWRKSDPMAKKIPVIVNSSLDDFSSIARALEMDSYDYFTKPLDQRQIETILPVKIRNAVNSRRLMAETSRQNEIMRDELELAARYQRFMLPSPAETPDLKSHYLFQPCTGVGGDYFDLFPLKQGGYGFLVADVSGHGVASAMTAAILKALTPNYLERFASPAMALFALNADLYRLTPEDSFVTCFAAIYRPAVRQLTWSSAGHPPALLQNGPGQPHRLTQESIFLGAFDSGDHLVEYNDQTIQVSQGHRLTMYTDGLIEATDPSEAQFGLARVETLLAASRERGLEHVCQQVKEDLFQFTQGHFPDDVAFIMVEF